MFVAEKMDLEKLLQLIPAEYYDEAKNIRNGIELYQGKRKLSYLQRVAIIFLCGTIYGEDQFIDRINYLESWANDLQIRNAELEKMLLEVNKKSTQDVKQED